MRSSLKNGAALMCPAAAAGVISVTSGLAGGQAGDRHEGRVEAGGVVGLVEDGGRPTDHCREDDVGPEPGDLADRAVEIRALRIERDVDLFNDGAAGLARQIRP